jgi:hypothetical protein
VGISVSTVQLKVVVSSVSAAAVIVQRTSTVTGIRWKR